MRTLLLFVGVLLLAFWCGRWLLPVAGLLAVAIAAFFWYAPDAAHWLDDELRLHRLIGFGRDHRQMALASLLYVGTAGLAGSLLFGGLGQALERGEAGPAVGLVPTFTTAPVVLPTLTPQPTLPPLPPPAVEPAAPSPAAGPATPAVPPPTRPEARPAAPAEPTPAPRPTFTPAARTATPAGPEPTSTRAAPPAPPGGELMAEIAGVSTSVAAGGRASLTARATPGATCALSVTYPGGAPGPGFTLTAGDDGLCTFAWTVSATTEPGLASATLVVSRSGRSQTRRASFAIS